VFSAIGGKLNFNMKIDKFLILILLSIFLLSFFTYWQFKRLSEAMPKIKKPEVEIPKPESIFQQKTEIKEFISPDGKLKFKYSSDWIEMPKESWQEINAEAKVLFFANKFKLEKAALASLIVQELDLEKEKSVKEIVEEIEKEVKAKNGEMEILNLEIKDKEADLKIKYKKETGPIFVSKEKIILGDNKFYLISIFALEKDWLEFENETNEIFNSIQLNI